ncbi:unnamed protein product, partial [Candidula unifasciata]
GHDYVPGYVESIPDRFIHTINVAIGLTYMTSPVIGVILYKRGHYTQEGGLNILKLALSLAAVYAAAYIIRGLGRAINADYRAFVTALVNARSGNATSHNKRELLQYDFDFWAAPVDFVWNEGMAKKDKKRSQPVTSTRRAQTVDRSSVSAKYLVTLP